MDVSPETRDGDGSQLAPAVEHHLPQQHSRPRDGSAPFAIEFCSGTGGLTAQFRKVGMTASFGVDRVVTGSSKAPIVKVDLGTSASTAILVYHVGRPRVPVKFQ